MGLPLVLGGQEQVGVSRTGRLGQTVVYCQMDMSRLAYWLGHTGLYMLQEKSAVAE